MSVIQVQVVHDVLVVDSRIIAEQLGVQHPLLTEIYQKQFLSAFDILAIVRGLSLSSSDETYKIRDLLKTAEDLSDGSSTFIFLKTAVIEALTLDIQNSSNEATSVLGWFQRNFLAYFPGAKMIKPYAINRKRPDCILEIAGVHYPVECKLSFSSRGLDQLKNYMKLWKVDRGIAVAHTFTVDLPQSISAIQTEKEIN